MGESELYAVGRRGGQIAGVSHRKADRPEKDMKLGVNVRGGRYILSHFDLYL